MVGLKLAGEFVVRSDDYITLTIDSENSAIEIYVWRIVDGKNYCEITFDQTDGSFLSLVLYIHDWPPQVYSLLPLKEWVRNDSGVPVFDKLNNGVVCRNICIEKQSGKIGLELDFSSSVIVLSFLNNKTVEKTVTQNNISWGVDSAGRVVCVIVRNCDKSLLSRLQSIQKSAILDDPAC